MLSATPLIGQVDDFQDGTTQNWTNGVAPDPVNTPGGQGGASDRFLQISSGAFGGGSKLASFNDTQWIGNYVTAGMTAVEMDLKNASASPESIRIALRSSPGGSATPGYASTTAFPLPADNAWHHAVFVLDSGSLTGVNSPAALSTFLTSVGDFRIVEAASGPALIGDTGNFQVGVDNITAVGQPQLNFQPSSVALPEGNAGPTLFVFDVMLSSVNGATVNYATADGSATTADSDYVAANGILTFAPGQTAKQITVQVNGDVTNEADENFTLSLSGPTNATLGVSAATGTIQNDDLFSTVAGRQIFYNNSAFDGSDVAINAADDSSIATDKTAYLPGAGLAVFTNVSSYNKGINGIMIDLAGGGSHGSIGIADFTFKASPVAGNNTPSGWAAGPGPTTISTRIGAGISGSDRVEIIWGANAVKNQWLEVQVLATANTGLPATDVFF